ELSGGGNFGTVTGGEGGGGGDGTVIGNVVGVGELGGGGLAAGTGGSGALVGPAAAATGAATAGGFAAVDVTAAPGAPTPERAASGPVPTVSRLLANTGLTALPIWNGLSTSDGDAAAGAMPPPPRP